MKTWYSEKTTWYKRPCNTESSPEEYNSIQKAVEEMAAKAHNAEITLYWNNQVNAFFIQSGEPMHDAMHAIGFSWIDPVEEGDINLLVLEQLWANY